MLYVVLDIETDMAHTRIDMAGVSVVSSGISGVYLTAASLTHYLESLEDEITLVTWNGQRFDIPLLKKIWGVDLSEYNHLDGMLLHKLMYHGATCGHSLKNVAKSMTEDPAYHKSEVDFDDVAFDELAEYCSQDLKVTWFVVETMLKSELYRSDRKHWKQALLLEQKVAMLVDKQVTHEVFFDTKRATGTYKLITKTMASIEETMEVELPRVDLLKSELHQPPRVQFKMSGEPSLHIINYCKKYSYEVFKAGDKYLASREGGGDIQTLPLLVPLVTDKQLILSNQAGIKDHLLSLGWKPTEWNTKFKDGKKVRTSARLTNKISKDPCSDLDRIGVTYVKLISEWLMLRSRKNVLWSDKGTGWIPRAEASPTSSIPSDADSMGANTCRWTHKIIANVPRASSPLGKEIRSCFRAREGKVWVGWDASALEARVEAHYVHPYDPEYAAQLIEGDVHTRNQKALGLATRDLAKTFKYAITYGAQAGTLSKTLGCSKAEAEVIYDKFWETNPALSKLKDSLNTEWLLNNKTYITALDGRKIWCRSEHSLVNALFQSAGAILMKYSMVIADHRIGKSFTYGSDEPIGLIRYHDEEIWECSLGDSEWVGGIGVKSIVEAGEYMKLNVPLAADYSVGDSWADVH